MCCCLSAGTQFYPAQGRLVPSCSSLAAKGLLRNKWGSGKKSLFCFLPACRCRAVLTQLRQRSANSCGQAGATGPRHLTVHLLAASVLLRWTPC